MEAFEGYRPHTFPFCCLSHQNICSRHMKGMNTVVKWLEIVCTNALFDQNRISCLAKTKASLSSDTQMLFLTIKI